MKRSIICLIILICMVFSSCYAPMIGAQTPKLDKPFSAIAEISFGNESCNAQIRRFSDESWEFCVTEPYALEGLIITLKNGETKLSMYGLEGFADFMDDAVSVSKLIANAVDAAKNAAGEKNGNEISISGESENAHYKLTLDDNGIPRSLILDGKGISVKFSEFTELPVKEQEEQDDEAPFVIVD